MSGCGGIDGTSGIVKGHDGMKALLAGDNGANDYESTSDARQERHEIDRWQWESQGERSAPSRSTADVMTGRCTNRFS